MWVSVCICHTWCDSWPSKSKELHDDVVHQIIMESNVLFAYYMKQISHINTNDIVWRTEFIFCAIYDFCLEVSTKGCNAKSVARKFVVNDLHTMVMLLPFQEVAFIGFKVWYYTAFLDSRSHPPTLVLPAYFAPINPHSITWAVNSNSGNVSVSKFLN